MHFWVRLVISSEQIYGLCTITSNVYFSEHFTACPTLLISWHTLLALLDTLTPESEKCFHV